MKNVTGTKLRAIHRNLRRKGKTTASLRPWARATAIFFAEDANPGLNWLGAGAAAWMRRKGMVALAVLALALAACALPSAQDGGGDNAPDPAAAPDASSIDKTWTPPVCSPEHSSCCRCS